MSNDPASGGGEQQPGWHGQQPYPGGYGQQPQQPEQPAYGSYPPPPTQSGAYGQAQPSWQQPAGQQRYAGYPAGTGGLPPQNESPSFFNALFDFGFNSFATPVVIKVLYILGLVAIGLAYVFLVISGFATSLGVGLGALVGGAIVALIYVILFRITLEFYYAVVRMSEDIRAMRNRS
ncbi:MAG: DUF4282 domain-containing protein [Pseudonocardia sp.]|nr:DUF4282 domain-containing protein [Pseudonocardia sp.]